MNITAKQKVILAECTVYCTFKYMYAYIFVYVMFFFFFFSFF